MHSGMQLVVCVTLCNVINVHSPLRERGGKNKNLHLVLERDQSILLYRVFHTHNGPFFLLSGASQVSAAHHSSLAVLSC